MIYYKRHLGDYAKNTRTLSTYEHGVYTLLLDLYYTDECPVSESDAYDICRATTEGERASVAKVLEKFFTRDGDNFRHSRADEEIAKYREKAATNKANGKAGGRPKKNPEKTQTVSESEPKRGAKQNLIHKPLSTIQEEAITPTALDDPPAADRKTSAEESVCETVVAAYHEALPRCQQINVLNPKRRRRILAADKLARKVCQQQGWEYDRAWFWANYFGECANDAWMRGEVPNPNNPKWRQNLDVLIAEDRFARIMDDVIAAERSA